jgi:hypothetical protein
MNATMLYLLPNSCMVTRERLSSVVPFIFAKFFRGIPLLPPLARIKEATCGSFNVPRELQP